MFALANSFIKHMYHFDIIKHLDVQVADRLHYRILTHHVYALRYKRKRKCTVESNGLETGVLLRRPNGYFP